MRPMLLQTVFVVGHTTRHVDAIFSPFLLEPTATPLYLSHPLVSKQRTPIATFGGHLSCHCSSQD